MNNTGADQPSHRHRLIRAFVIRFLESIISKLATGEISNFSLASVAEKSGLKLALSETPKTGFLATRPIFIVMLISTVHTKLCFYDNGLAVIKLMLLKHSTLNRVHTGKFV